MGEATLGGSDHGRGSSAAIFLQRVWDGLVGMWAVGIVARARIGRVVAPGLSAEALVVGADGADGPRGVVLVLGRGRGDGRPEAELARVPAAVQVVVGRRGRVLVVKLGALAIVPRLAGVRVPDDGAAVCRFVGSGALGRDV